MISKISVLAALFFLTFCIWYAFMHPYVLSAPSSSAVKPLQYTENAKLGETHLYIAKAETQSEQIQGLSGQMSIGEDQGLLFVFDTDGNNSIWMKDMLFPIDVLWLDQDLKVVYIKENFLPASYPKVESSPTPSRHVLELKTGFVSENKIKIGDMFSL